MTQQILLSAGIDIGTSTTQVIFSHITIDDMSNGFAVPRVEIIGKDVFYQSEVQVTPLLDPTNVDAEGVRNIVEAEYAHAGISPAEVDTGAVVITGETARKDNARQVLDQLADYAGDFVVATAGPILESIIAAKGAGVDSFSKLHSASVAHFDIGGGTSNFALFCNGNLINASCLDIGGHLITFDNEGIITLVSPKVAKLATSVGVSLEVGKKTQLSELERISQAMCELVEMSLGLRPKSDFYATIITDGENDVMLDEKPDFLSFSGGVADCFADAGDFLRFGDIGPFLGQALAQSELLATIPRFNPPETIRATVIGAGAHVTELSGSTITYDASLLPMKNLPIVRIDKAHEENPVALARQIARQAAVFQIDEPQPIAIAMAGPVSPSFVQLTELANSIVNATQDLRRRGCSVVVVTEADLAKALGQSISAVLGGSRGVVCIDGIAATNCDYIDIGMPVAGGTAVPVAIKTLAFN